MKYLLKVAEFRMKPGSQDELYYTDDKGELFIGPKKDVIIGKTYPVEVDPKSVGGHYYRIILWGDFQENSEERTHCSVRNPTVHIKYGYVK